MPASVSFRAVVVGWSVVVLAGAASAQQSSVADLAAAARSPHEATQLKAIEDLAAHGGAGVPVLSELLRSDSPVVRAYAARSLGKIGHDASGATEGVIALLADADPAVRRQAVDALKGIRPGPKIGIPIFARLMEDADPGIRMRVMQAVADAGGEAVPALIEGLKNPATSYWACLILRDIGPDAAPAAPALRAALKDARPEVRREAVLALAAIGAADSAEPIVRLLDDEQVRNAATFALGALGNVPPPAEPTLRANANSKDPLLSTTSLWTLARVHPQDTELLQRAVTHLVASLTDENPFVRTAAARALSALPPHPEIAGPVFEKALANADETTTHYLLDAIAGLGAPAVPRLIAALKHPGLRPQVAAILGQIGPPAAAATPALAQLLGDEDPNTAIEAAHALANIGPAAKAAVPALIEALQQHETGLAHAAAYALGRMGPAAAQAEPALVQGVESVDNSWSLLCAWALVQIRGPSADTARLVLPELITGLQSPLTKSRQMAAETLASLGTAAAPALQPLEKIARDPDASVREAAAQALRKIRTRE